MKHLIIYWLVAMAGYIVGAVVTWLLGRREIGKALAEAKSCRDKESYFHRMFSTTHEALAFLESKYQRVFMGVQALYREHKEMADRAIGIPDTTMVTAVESAKASAFNQVLGLFKEL